MALSFSFRSEPFPALDRPLRVLVTGAAGRIGRTFAQHAAGKYTLRLMVRGDESQDSLATLPSLGEVVRADLTDRAALHQHCSGIDVVLHLAANTYPNAVWDELSPANITGTYNLFSAAVAQRCRRVVFASSIHAASGLASPVQIKASEPPVPGDLYGVSKVFGEALARYLSAQEGLSAICLRIGAFKLDRDISPDVALAFCDTLITPRDLNQLIEKSIDDRRLQFAIFHGVSNNHFRRFDIEEARELIGYHPQDDAAELHPDLAALNLSRSVYSHNNNRGGD
jgi:nucleoside-diphosphate-sugar epimerase